MLFKDVNFAMALTQLKNWSYFEEPELDRLGNPQYDEREI